MSVDNETLKSFLKDPAEHFKLPAEVVSHPDLDEQQKRDILESWRVDEQELAKATEENMGESDNNLLEQVVAALHALQS